MSTKIPAVLVGFALAGAAAPRSPAQDAKPEFDPFSEEAAAALAEGDDSADATVPHFLEPGQVSKLTGLAKPSLVTVRQIGRDGEERGTGAGFVVSKDGLVATNLHVIGEGRPVEVELSDGSVHSVVEVHAFDRHYDLAVVRIDASDRDLQPLAIGDFDEVSQGDLAVGFGSPQGLEFSVVTGAISAIRKLEPGFLGQEETPDYPMLQLAMPIEQGNSGGPVLNLDGEVLGVITLRHRVTDNLGFAVPSRDLQKLLDDPNPVPMSRWRTIGVLDPERWTPVMGAEWTQRGGTIRARQLGDGFGGRSLCLSAADVPESPYEVAVRIRLGDVSGAAGIAFSSDGKDVHYGFYPSGGKMRLTRFEGPDVYSWSILEEIDTPAYEPGEWNRLRVRVEEKTLTGWVNGEKLFTIPEDELRGGRAGLCKFRRTEADFRKFRVDRDLGREKVPAEERERIDEVISRFIDGESEGVLDELSRNSGPGRRRLLERAERLDALAGELRSLEDDLHRQTVVNELVMALDRPEGQINLFEVGLHIARIDDPRLDLAHYRSAFARLVNGADAYLEKNAGGEGIRASAVALRDFLFEENGFHGSRTEYYHHANSYVNRVLDDREGLPITLSIIYIEMARRLGIDGVHGAPLPGKFMVGVEAGARGEEVKTAGKGRDGGKEKDRGEAETFYIDAFERGEILDREAAADEVRHLLGGPPELSSFGPASARGIALRMLRNLVDIEINRRNTPEDATDYLEVLLAIEPDAAQERFQRALLRIQEEDLSGAREDIDWLLEHRPPGIDYSRLEVFRGRLNDG